MPTLKQLTCHIEWANCSIPFKEYGVTYGDGSVDCFIPVQPASTPFSIRLTSSGYIAPGLAMFVYMDGVYQCNRNRNNLISRGNSGKGKKRVKDVNFCVRQKEERLANGTWIGRPWRFEPLQIVQLMPGMPEINKSHFDNLGEISVVVLRCESRREQCSSEGSLSPESAMAFGPDLDDLQSISSDEYFLGPSDTTKGNDTNCGIIGGLFDGADDRRRHSHDRDCCEGCARQERDERRRRHERRRHSGQPDNITRRRHIGHSQPDPPCRVHWEDKPRRVDESDLEHEWHTYDDESTASSDHIRQGYRYYRSSGPTYPIPKSKVEDSDSPRYYSRRRYPKQRRSLPERPKQEQRSENQPNGTTDKAAPEEPNVSHAVMKEEEHSGNRGCAPSIVLNVNSALPAPATKPDIFQRCPRENSADISANINKDGNQDNNKPASDSSRDNTNGDAGNNAEPDPGGPATQDNANWDNGNKAQSDTGWPAAADNQNHNTTDTVWDQKQGDNGWNNDSNGQKNNNFNSSQTGWEAKGQGGQGNQEWNNGGSGAQDRSSGNGEPPAVHWQSNGSNNNNTNWENNITQQNGPLTSPNNGFNNPQPCPSGPPPPIIPVQAQGPMWEPPPPVQRVHTLITPFCQGQEASEPPLYTVPDQVAQERSLSHQVQVGKSSTYSHKVQVPLYLDTMEEPYAKFVFKYRIKDVIASAIGKPIERDVEAERRLLESLPREEILNQLLHAHGLLAAQALGQPQNIPFQGQQQIPPIQQQQQHNQQNTVTQQQNPAQPNTNSNVSHTNQGPPPNPASWNNAPAYDEPIIVPSKLTGYNNIGGNPSQVSSQNKTWAEEVASRLQNHQQQQQSASNNGNNNNDTPAWNNKTEQAGGGTQKSPNW
ncbi:uncharacterized protein GIQ15_04814 [Arthroderma uncinatum]|uniref:uncharacterized protein n=1 Tax=Arthroderma uncinatum TaxID=74035 RepID=UPI00144AA584|nr:uncharacterized protein GIQ15_04814 [Arthroderma uncinatum]KAF3482055.1 hypothetical protein GIQ15_04814 [Arthroderma uncinatum]